MTPYVLIVDDDKASREVLRAWLESLGRVVQDAANAAGALEQMTEHPAGVVFVDIRMPGHDGLWLAQRLKRQWPEVPIVFASGVDDISAVERARRLGAVDYVTKPFQWEMLIQALRRADEVAETPDS